MRKKALFGTHHNGDYASVPIPDFDPGLLFHTSFVPF